MKKSALTMITVALSGILAALMLSCDSEGPKRVQEGNEAFEAGDYQQAQEAYDSALETMPESVAATYNSANALYKRGEYEQALSKYEDIAESTQPELLQDSTYNYARSLWEAGRQAEAIEAMKQALRLDPSDRDAKIQLQNMATPTPSPTPPPEDQQQQQEGGEEDSTPTPEQGEDGTPTPQQNQGGTPTPTPDEEGQEDDEQSEENESESESENPNPSDSQPEPGEVPPTGMTEEQAEQLLEAVADNSETLRSRILEDTFFMGIPPEREW